MKKCRQCGKDYPDTVGVCPIDAQPLLRVSLLPAIPETQPADSTNPPPIRLRALLGVLIGLEIFLVFAAFTPIYINRRSARVAFIEWREHPSPDTEASWRSEQGALRHEHAIIESVTWTMIVATGAGILCVARRLQLRV